MTVGGRRIDSVSFHPAWHELLRLAISRGIVSMPWIDSRPAAHVARAALFYLHAQAEAGTQCPLSMSYGVIPTLRRHGAQTVDVVNVWLPKLLSSEYDLRMSPARSKSGVLFGMGMTERQGGSDLRKTVTQATLIPANHPRQTYAIRGHKWFFSAPMCDAFLILAQVDEQLSCFLIPQFRRNGERNALRLQRLKNKLGNHSNASTEVEFHDAEAYLVGELGRGIPTIIEMAASTRVDCVLASAGIQRRVTAMALDHARQREAFGKGLIEQPLMREVLADMALECEAATRLAIYLAHCTGADATEQESALARILTPAAKFHVCKVGSTLAQEAMEVMGGNGYVEGQ